MKGGKDQQRGKNPNTAYTNHRKRGHIYKEGKSVA
jgi:hypothetical protein